MGAEAVINQCMYRLLTIITMGHFGKWLVNVGGDSLVWDEVSGFV